MKLHLYILRELLVSFAFTFGGILVLTLPAITAVAVQKLAGVPILLVLRYVPLIEAGLIPYILPLAFLLAVVSTYGRLAADNEWTAIRMSGRNPITCFFPGVAFAFVLGALTLWMLADTLPDIRARQNDFSDAARADMPRNFSSGRTEVQIGDFYVSAATREGDDFVDAYVYVPKSKDGKEAQTLLADRVTFSSDDKFIYAKLINMRTFVNGKEMRLGESHVQFGLDMLTSKGRDRSRLRYLTSADMSEELAGPDVPKKRAEELRYEIETRRATASTCLMFLLLGAPTALLLRRGTQLKAVAVSVSYVLLYYLLSMRVGKLLAQTHTVSPEIAAWTVAVVGLGAGSFLTWKALRE